MAKFEKGNPGGGRPKGSKDKRTVQWQTFSEYCLNGGLERFEQELNSLEGKQFVDAFLTLLEYHKPKLARTEVKHELENETIKQLVFVAKGSTGK